MGNHLCRSSAYTVVCLPHWTPWTTSGHWTEYRRCEQHFLLRLPLISHTRPASVKGQAALGGGCPA